ncbi:MAG TPA: ABC transporter substrate-binding protein, partial [Lachnoclostridium sp.]|nr:ABC transporter substrate-binding protein [Lachnoclostridium sp.]
MKRAIRIIMAAGMAALAVTGCGSGSSTQATTAQTTAAGVETTVGESSAPAENKEAQVITFWYNNTGDEAAVYEKAISEYNASQSNYKVEGLSVTDAQKVIVAMS